MNVALVMPKATFLIDPMVYPPLGLWYLAAQLEVQGHPTEFFDLAEDELPPDGAFDQIWVSATSSQMYDVRRIGQVFETYQATRTVLGGPAVWASPTPIRVPGYDVVVSGEADEPRAIERILATQAKGVHLYFGTQKGVNHILLPVRRWSHRYRAHLTDRNGLQHPTTTMFTSRGCPMACAFCESGRNGIIWSKTVRYEPLDLVRYQLREIRSLGFTGVMFYDDILPLNKPRTLEILAELKSLGFVWRCFIRTDIIEKQGGFEYLEQMADAGLVEVLAGIETADNRIKEAIGKGTTIEQDTQVLHWCKELGVRFKASIILGLPGEDRTSLQRTRNWILDNRPDRADVNVLIPLPGTPITTHREAYDIHWAEEYPEEFWFKGPRGESNAFVGTSSLEPGEIKAFRDDLISVLEAEGIPY